MQVPDEKELTTLKGYIGKKVEIKIETYGTCWDYGEPTDHFHTIHLHTLLLQYVAYNMISGEEITADTTDHSTFTFLEHHRGGPSDYTKEIIDISHDGKSIYRR